MIEKESSSTSVPNHKETEKQRNVNKEKGHETAWSRFECYLSVWLSWSIQQIMHQHLPSYTPF
jgi:hypothetical protein